MHSPLPLLRAAPDRTVMVAAAIACAIGLLLTASGVAFAGFTLCAVAVAVLVWAASREPARSEPVLGVALPTRAEPDHDQMGPILEAMPDPTLLVGANGHIASANAAARRMLGFATPGLRLSAVLRRPELLDAVDAAARDGAVLAVDYEVTAPVEEHFRVFVAPVTFGVRHGALMAFQDQTTTINTDRMRADFLANASHELRTPLAAMTLLIETLSGHAKNDPAAREKFLKMMYLQANRMRELIDDLLSLSKIELNEHVPPAEHADLAVIVKDMIETLAPQAGEREVQVRFQRPDTPAIVVGVRDDREEAAAKAGRQWDEASRVALLSPPPAAGRQYAYLRVADSGPGISRRYLPRLSERFFRVERDEGAEQSGTGLGLAIVKHIINRHRGGLMVESEQGRGSAFAVYLERPAPDETQGPQGPGAGSS